jgi:tetratricopeptide (TPR) repeat protein
MNISLEELLPQIERTTTGIKSALNRNLLAEATKLAHAGRYLEAETLLQRLNGEKQEDQSVLSLLARIRAQQGRLMEAEQLLTRALELAPGDASNREALQTLREIQQERGMTFLRQPGILILLLAVMSAACLALWHGRTQERRGEAPRRITGGSLSPRGSDVSAPQLGMPGLESLPNFSVAALGYLSNAVSRFEEMNLHLQEAVSSNQQALTEIRLAQAGPLLPISTTAGQPGGAGREFHTESQRNHAEMTSALTDLLLSVQSLRKDLDRLSAVAESNDRPGRTWMPSIQVAGVAVESDQNHSVVKFEQAIFSRNMLVRPEAKEMLVDLAHQLASTKSAFRIEVVGCAEAVPLFGRRDSLALKRAAYVSELLKAEAGFTSDQISIRAASPREIAAFSNDSSGPYHRETVVIHLYVSP